MVVILGVIAYTDWKTKRIPNQWILSLLSGGIVAIRLYPEIAVGNRVAGFFLISVPLLLLACIIPGSIGGGDIKLMAAGGLLLGVTGIWKAFVTGIFASAAASIVLLFQKKVDTKTEIPLGPFLTLGIGIGLFRI